METSAKLPICSDWLSKIGSKLRVSCKDGPKCKFSHRLPDELCPYSSEHELCKCMYGNVAYRHPSQEILVQRVHSVELFYPPSKYHVSKLPKKGIYMFQYAASLVRKFHKKMKKIYDINNENKNKHEDEIKNEDEIKDEDEIKKLRDKYKDSKLVDLEELIKIIETNKIHYICKDENGEFIYENSSYSKFNIDSRYYKISHRTSFSKREIKLATLICIDREYLCSPNKFELTPFHIIINNIHFLLARKYLEYLKKLSQSELENHRSTFFPKYILNDCTSSLYYDSYLFNLWKKFL